MAICTSHNEALRPRFLLGVAISTSTYAFFQSWINMPPKMIQQMMQPPLVEKCTC